MQPKVLIGIFLSASVIAFALVFEPPPYPRKHVIAEEQSTVVEGEADPKFPIRLLIPKIHLFAPLEHVSLAADGSMDVPKHVGNAAWFSLGPLPGEKGNAVIDGHYGWKDGISAAFDDLDKLKAGDTFSVQYDKGRIIPFIVRKVKLYPESASTTDIFVSKDDNAHLNLITCDGDWNVTKESYPSRLVVFADKM